MTYLTATEMTEVPTEALVEFVLFEVHESNNTEWDVCCDDEVHDEDDWMAAVNAKNVTDVEVDGSIVILEGRGTSREIVGYSRGSYWHPPEWETEKITIGWSAHADLRFEERPGVTIEGW